MLLPVLFILLASCSGGGGDVSPNALISKVTGTVRAAPQDANLFVAQASSARSGLAPFSGIRALARILSPLLPTAQAAVSGLTPVVGATVELLRLDAAGHPVLPPLASTVTDASGNYAFNNTPAPASTLAVRVVGQPGTMRAFVTGGAVDISPVSEQVTREILNSLLIGGKPLSNFAVQEVALLNQLLSGMQVNLTGLSFTASLTALSTASTPILPDMAAAMARPGVGGSLNNLANKGFGMVGLSAFFADPSTAGLVGGVGVRRSDGAAFFDVAGLVSGASGRRFFSSALHTLTQVNGEISSVDSLSGLTHIVTPTGQMVVETRTGQAVAGLVSPDGQLLAYPIDVQSGAGFLRQGLRVGIRNGTGNQDLGKAQQLTNKTLDALVSPGGTAYNMVALELGLSGPLASGPVNSATVTIRHGSMTFDTTTQVALPNSGATDLYARVDLGQPATPSISSSQLEQALQSPYASINSLFPATAQDLARRGFYRIFADGTLLLLKEDGGFLGSGIVSSDGGLLVYDTGSDAFTEVTLNVLANDHTTTTTPLTITGVNLTASALGAVGIDPSGKSLSYTPSLLAPVPATDTFDYTVSSDGGVTSTTATVTLALVKAGTPPTLGVDHYTVAPGSTLNRLNVLANDGQGLCVFAVTPSLGVTAIVSPALDAVLYDAAAGPTDTLSYTVGRKSINATTGTLECISPLLTNNVTITIAATSPQAAPDAFRIDIENRATRGLTLAARQTTTAPTLGGTYTVLGFSQDTTPIAATATLAMAYRNGKLVLDGGGGVSSGSLASKRATLDLATAVAGASLSTGLTPVVAPDVLTPTGNTYTVTATGAVTLSLLLNSGETVSGQGFASADGNLIVLVTEVSDSFGRLGRGLMILARQS